MYTDYWIKAADQDSWLTQARAAGIIMDIPNIDGVVVTVPISGVNIDEIGTIYTPGEYKHDTNGNIEVITLPVALPGFHVNIRSQSPLNITELSVIAPPKKPNRVWF